MPHLRPYRSLALNLLPLFAGMSTELSAGPNTGLSTEQGAEQSFAQVFISELHYDNAGADEGEAVEIAGPADTPVDGWQLVFYNGSGGAVYATVPLAGTLQRSGDCPLGYQVLAYPGIQNGSPDAIALVDEIGDVVDFISYEGPFSASVGPAAGLSAVDIGVFESSSSPLGYSLQRIDGEWQEAAPATFGSCSGAVGEPAQAVKIHALQGKPESYLSNRFGETDVSPLIDQTVQIEAVVIGDFQNADADTRRELGGFFLQEEQSDEDGDPRSSEGVFVYAPDAADVQLGDLVRVTGTVGQYFGETQLRDIQELDILRRNALDLVAPVDINLGSNSATSRNQNGAYQPDLEAYEGMWVRFPEPLSISEQFQLDRFNEIRLVAGARPYQFSQLQQPNPELYEQHLAALGARTITYDDGLNTQNAAIELLDGFAGYSETSAKRMGDTVRGLSGVLDYKWAGNSASGATWRVRANGESSNVFTSTQTEDSNNPRPATAPAVAGDLKIASLNVLNYFKTLNTRGASTAIGLGPRGANTDEELSRQTLKTVNAILAMDADLIGLVEIENEFDPTNDGSTAIEMLVNALNSAAGGTRYDYVYPNRPFVGDDAIAVAMLYKPAVLEFRGSAILDDEAAARLDIYAARDFSSDPIFSGASTNRASLAASFSHRESQDVFTAVVNHLKSKGSSPRDQSDPNADRRDGAGAWNQRRLDGVTALKAWLETAPTAVDDEDILLMGDFNAYASEEPVQYLLSQGFVNVEDADAYSYVFDGQLGTLDYLLISDSLVEKFEDAAVWHINADEADALDYNLDFGRDPVSFNAATATRNSDHDPLLAGFDFAQDLTTAQSLVDFYKSALNRGDLQGLARTYFVQRWQEFWFFLILHSAQNYEARSNTAALCSTLRFASALTDARAQPRDLIQGPALSEFQALLQRAITSADCP